MNQLVTFAKQVLSRIEADFQKLKKRSGTTDDTVEAQARTFRIWMWSSSLGLAIILISSVISMSTKAGERKSIETNRPAQTSLLESLPEGFVIAPIEPTNIESLDSIFENHGYADLYRASGLGGRGSCIVRGVPLIRAPKNPRRFAVLIPEEQSGALAALNEPVLVILRKKPTKAKAPAAPKRVRVRKVPLDIIQEDIPEIANNESGVKP